MSRVAKSPVELPSGVEAKLAERELSVKGSRGQLSASMHPMVDVSIEDNQIQFSAADRPGWAMAGTMRALAANMVAGCSTGFEKKLELVGVGYRAQVQGKKLNLTLGFSHPVVYEAPDGVEIKTPSQTEILVSGADKQQVGQVAAKIRAYRPPEPYKGKGVRYAGERIVMKEGKKK